MMSEGGDMPGDSGYYVESHDWPIGTEASITTDVILKVFNEFDRFYSAAVKALALTPVPTSLPSDQPAEGSTSA
jgi:hypothetical protein